MPVVATNTAANSALRFLNNNSSMAAGSVGKLASGSRIVKASDDAAGLAIGTRLKADVTALTQAGINASQGASVVQVADGGLARFCLREMVDKVCYRKRRSLPCVWYTISSYKHFYFLATLQPGSAR